MSLTEKERKRKEQRVANTRKHIEVSQRSRGLYKGMGRRDANDETKYGTPFRQNVEK